MKLPSPIKFAALAALAASPLAFAEDAAAPDALEVVICEVAPSICTPDLPVNDTMDVIDDTVDVIDDTVDVIDGEAVTKEPADGEAVDIPIDDEITTIEDGGVPIEWVKRDGELENPDVIFYNMVAVSATAADKSPTNAALTRELGEDDKPAAIENKGASAASVEKASKKSPVALVKQGRVFLR